MPHQDVHVRGTVRDLFAHRFTLETDQGLLLADITPEGLDLISLSAGDSIEIAGERKPSEIKVRHLTRGETTIDIAPRPKPGKDRGPEAEADPDKALAAVRQAGFEPSGEPHRKPKHFAIDAAKDGRLFEMHVTFAGEVKHARPRPDTN